MTPAMKWALGIGTKPDLVTFVPAPVVFEKVYPIHSNGNEIDPRDHQCYGCSEVTEWICKRCENPFCYEHAGHPTQFCENIGLCKDCADDRYSYDY